MSDGKKYYCMCGSNCKYETMTKEQILAAIVQAVESGEVHDVDTGFVTKVKDQNSNGYVTFWVGTQAQYNALDNIDVNCLYIISDATSMQDIGKALADHIKNAENPHNVTAAQVGAPTVEEAQAFANSVGLPYRGLLGNADPNNLSYGIYVITTNSTNPVNDVKDGLLVQFGHVAANGSCVQLLWDYGATTMSQRSCWFGTWYPWYSVYDKNSNTSAAGIDISDKIALSSDTTAGGKNLTALSIGDNKRFVYYPAMGIVHFHMNVYFKGTMTAGEKLEFVHVGGYAPSSAGGIATFPITTHKARFAGEYVGGELATEGDRLYLQALQAIDTKGLGDSENISGWYFCDGE